MILDSLVLWLVKIADGKFKDKPAEYPTVEQVYRALVGKSVDKQHKMLAKRRWAWVPKNSLLNLEGSMESLIELVEHEGGITTDDDLFDGF